MLNSYMGERFFEIHFSDLKEDVQKELLEYANEVFGDVDSPSDMNWDIFPVSEIHLEDEVEGLHECEGYMVAKNWDV